MFERACVLHFSRTQRKPLIGGMGLVGRMLRCKGQETIVGRHGSGWGEIRVGWVAQCHRPQGM